MGSLLFMVNQKKKFFPGVPKFLKRRHCKMGLNSRYTYDKD